MDSLIQPSGGIDQARPPKPHEAERARRAARFRRQAAERLALRAHLLAEHKATEERERAAAAALERRTRPVLIEEPVDGVRDPEALALVLDCLRERAPRVLLGELPAMAKGYAIRLRMLGVVSAEAEREIRAVLPFKFQTGEADRAIKAAIVAAYRVP